VTANRKYRPGGVVTIGAVKSTVTIFSAISTGWPTSSHLSLDDEI
jgi:hypothetical protein